MKPDWRPVSWTVAQTERFVLCRVGAPKKNKKNEDKEDEKQEEKGKRTVSVPCSPPLLLFFLFRVFSFFGFFFILVSEWKGGGGWWFFFLIQNFESIHDEYLAQANESQRKIHWNELDLQKKKIDQSRHEAKKKNASVADTGRRFQLRRTRKARATTE